MSRDEFAKLSLYDKNTYLQDLAKRFAEHHDRQATELDKDTLSRLRRYYLRRVWADMKIDELGDTPMSQALRGLGEAIRADSVKADISAVLMQETLPKRTLRSPPTDDAQLMFFVPTIYDAPIKDDVNLMDVAPFSLGKKASKGVIPVSYTHLTLPTSDLV